MYFVLGKEWCGTVKFFDQPISAKRMLNRLLDLISTLFYKMRASLGVLLKFKFDHLKTLDFTNPMHMFRYVHLTLRLQILIGYSKCLYLLHFIVSLFGCLLILVKRYSHFLKFVQ